MGGNPARFAIACCSGRCATYIAGDLDEGIIRFWRYSRATSREDVALGIEPWPFRVSWIPGLPHVAPGVPKLYVERTVGITLTGKERGEVGVKLGELVETARMKEPEAPWSSVKGSLLEWVIDDTVQGCGFKEELYIECGDERPPVVIDDTQSFTVPLAFAGFTDMIRKRFHLMEPRKAVAWNKRMSDGARLHLVEDALDGDIELAADILMHGKVTLIGLLIEMGRGYGLSYDFSDPDEYVVSCGRSMVRGFRRYSARRCIELLGPVLPSDNPVVSVSILQGAPS